MGPHSPRNNGETAKDDDDHAKIGWISGEHVEIHFLISGVFGVKTVDDLSEFLDMQHIDRDGGYVALPEAAPDYYWSSSIREFLEQRVVERLEQTVIVGFYSYCPVLKIVMTIDPPNEIFALAAPYVELLNHETAIELFVEVLMTAAGRLAPDSVVISEEEGFCDKKDLEDYIRVAPDLAYKFAPTESFAEEIKRAIEQFLQDTYSREGKK